MAGSGRTTFQSAASQRMHRTWRPRSAPLPFIREAGFAATGSLRALPPPPVAGSRGTGFSQQWREEGRPAWIFRRGRIRRPGPGGGAQAGRFEQEQARADGSGSTNPAGPCQRRAVESRIGTTRLQGLSCRLARSGRTRWTSVETLRNPTSGRRPKSHSPRAPARPTRRKMRTWSSCRTRN